MMHVYPMKGAVNELIFSQSVIIHAHEIVDPPQASCFGCLEQPLYEQIGSALFLSTPNGMIPPLSAGFEVCLIMQRQYCSTVESIKKLRKSAEHQRR